MSAMMGHPKAAASLSSGLLARKGHARPAMRPQGFSGFGNLAEAIDDLGWNDVHGDDVAVDEAQAAPIDAVPPVLVERKALKQEIEAKIAPEPEPEPEAVAVEPAMSPAALNRIGRTVRAKQSKPKTAFTLRLDNDRHLRLRLATAVTNRSAQLLVTEALDAFLASFPEIEQLASALPGRGRKNQGD